LLRPGFWNRQDLADVDAVAVGHGVGGTGIFEPGEQGLEPSIVRQLGNRMEIAARGGVEADGLVGIGDAGDGVGKVNDRVIVSGQRAVAGGALRD